MKIHKTFNKYSHKKITETIDICGLCLTSAANWMAAAAAVSR